MPKNRTCYRRELCIFDNSRVYKLHIYERGVVRWISHKNGAASPPPPPPFALKPVNQLLIILGTISVNESVSMIVTHRYSMAKMRILTHLYRFKKRSCNLSHISLLFLQDSFIFGLQHFVTLGPQRKVNSHRENLKRSFHLLS